MAAAPQSRPPRKHGDIGFVVFLAFLALLTLLLWMADPSHFSAKDSRDAWPSQTSP